MKHSRSLERGQAIVLIAFAIAGLIAIIGLAIDGGFVFADRRHAQNAADASSLAGALEKINGPELIERVLNGETGYTEYGGKTASELAAMSDTQLQTLINSVATNTALNIAKYHGFDSDLVTNSVAVEIPPVSGPYVDDSHYVQVIIFTSRDTFFAKIVGVAQTHSTVEAVAKAKEPVVKLLYGGSSIVALKPTSSDCSGDFVVGGSGNVVIDGGQGLFVNSSGECAFSQSGCNVALTSSSGDPVPISVVGNNAGEGYNEDSCNPDTMNTDPNVGVDPVPWTDGVLILDEPDECSKTPDAFQITTDAVGHKTATLFPGSYAQLPPPSINADEIFLSPGIYCVSKVLKQTTGILKGYDVFFYITKDGDFSLQGGTNILHARAAEDPPDPEKYPYAGYLVYVAPDFDGSPENCTINGNQESSFVGAIYAPYCNVTINGSTGTDPDDENSGFHSQVIGYEVKLNGDGDLWFIYNQDENVVVIEAAELDLAQ